jgi:hypothetical protein
MTGGVVMAEAMRSEQAPTRRVARGAALDVEERAGAAPALVGLDPETLAHANGAVGRGMAAIGEELGRFVWQRLQADLEMSRSLMACTEIEEAMRLQQRFITAAMADYAEEGRTLADLAGAMLRESMGMVEGTRH